MSKHIANKLHSLRSQITQILSSNSQEPEKFQWLEWKMYTHYKAFLMQRNYTLDFHNTSCQRWLLSIKYSLFCSHIFFSNAYEVLNDSNRYFTFDSNTVLSHPSSLVHSLFAAHICFCKCPLNANWQKYMIIIAYGWKDRIYTGQW